MFSIQEVAEKSSVTLSEVGKVKIELNQVLNKLEAERKVQADLREQLGESDRKMSGIIFMCFQNNITDLNDGLYHCQIIFYKMNYMKMCLFSEQLLKHRSVTEEKDLELEDIKRRLKAREHELSNYREDENQRVQVLQSAVMQFLNKTPNK